MCIYCHLNRAQGYNQHLLSTLAELALSGLNSRFWKKAALPGLAGGALTCLLLLPVAGLADSEAETEPTRDGKSSLFLDDLCPPESLVTEDQKTADPNEPGPAGKRTRSCRQPGALTNYQSTASQNNPSDKSVEAELASNIRIKPAVIPIDFVH